MLLSVVAWRQTKHWRNGITLFSHALETGVHSEVVYNNLGIALEGEKRFEEATDFVQEVKKLEKPYDTLTARLPGI